MPSPSFNPYGARRLDYVFNNAGIGSSGEANDIPLDAWRRIVDINLYGVLHGVLAAYPVMRKQGFGHIVNTASLAGLGPHPMPAGSSPRWRAHRSP